MRIFFSILRCADHKTSQKGFRSLNFGSLSFILLEKNRFYLGA